MFGLIAAKVVDTITITKEISEEIIAVNMIRQHSKTDMPTAIATYHKIKANVI